MLIDYLIENKKLTHKKAKNYLTKGYIWVNGKIITKYNYIVKNTDQVEIIFKDKNDNFNILYEDKYLIVVYKRSGLLSVSTEKEKEKTLYHMVSDYVKSRNKKNKIFVVHRLDKDTSGIVIFAKDEKIKNLLQNNWDNLVKKRGYIALVEGRLEENGTLVNYLKEDNYRVYVSSSGKKAITNYQVLKANKNYSLLDIDIETGRKNQIRVQFSSINHPIVGDIKYGNKKSPLKRLCLEADELILIHPITRKELSFRLELNEQFLKLI